jgi:hypothetical protein
MASALKGFYWKLVKKKLKNKLHSKKVNKFFGTGKTHIIRETIKTKIKPNETGIQLKIFKGNNLRA